MIFFEPPELPGGSTLDLLYAGERRQRRPAHRRQPLLLFRREGDTHTRTHTSTHTAKQALSSGTCRGQPRPM